MRRLILALLVFVASAVPLTATTITAASCSQADFQTAFNAASDGDTILGPSGGGSATWTSTIVSTKTLIIIGSGCSITANGSDIFNLTWTNSAFVPRITNFTLNGFAGGAMFRLNGNVPAFRVDHITVNAVPHTGNPYFIWFNQSAFVHYYKDMAGLIDHITYNCTQNGTCDAFLFYGRDWNWLSPNTMGTASAIYIEDSTFTCTACTGQHFNTVTDGQHGARFVVRYSTFQNMSISEHDVGVGLDRGTRQYEVYNNTFTCVGTSGATCFNATAIRGGTNMVFNNSIKLDSAGLVGWAVSSFSEIFRLADPGQGQIPWNGIIVSNPNHIFSPGNNPNGCFSQTPTGACAGASTGGVSSDFYPHATTTPFAFCTAQSATCFSNPPIGSNVGQAIYTGFPDYTGGAVANTLLSQIDGLASNGYPARDQTGAGPDTGVNHTQTGGAEPAYFFNNTCGAGSPSCTPGNAITNFYTAGVNIGSFITANKDFYQQGSSFTGATGVGVGLLSARPATCTPKVGFWATDSNTLYTCSATNTWTVYYQPYTYPHPLQGGVVAPSAPTGLSATASGSNINLAWTLPTGQFTGETVYRGTTFGGPYVAIASGLTGASYTDTPGNGTFYYVVTAFNGGNISTVSGNGTRATVTCMTTCVFSTGSSFTLAGNSAPAFNVSTTVASRPTNSTFTFASTSTAVGSGGGAWVAGAESAKSNEANATLPVNLTVSLQPASTSFGTLLVGNTSAPQTVTLTNTSPGGNIVTLSGIGIGGTNPGDFAQTNNCPLTLSSGASCQIQVTATPQAAGARSGTVTVTDNAAGSPQSVSLSVTGTSALPGASLTPASITFGAQLVSTPSSAVGVTLTNTGTGTLTISSIVTSGDFSNGTTCGATLGPGLNCTINVTFTPSAQGTRTGTLTVTDNAASSPQTVSLAGVGVTSIINLTGTVTISGPTTGP